MKRAKKVLVIHAAPGKTGKQEARFFKNGADAIAYFERNTQEGQFPGRLTRAAAKKAAAARWGKKGTKRGL